MFALLIKRHLRLYFRDRASVFFSLLGVIIIMLLYILFLGNMLEGAAEEFASDDARFIMDSWIMAGVIAVASITTAMGAFGIAVNDKEKHILKDFQVSPIKRTTLLASYLVATAIIGFVMSVLVLVFAEVYIVMYGGEWLSLSALLKTIGLIALAVMSSTSIVFFIITMIKTQNAFGTASSLMGTLIGFLTGIYIPIGQLPSSIQTIIKIFPLSHAVVLMRQVMMGEALSVDAMPEQFVSFMGLRFTAGDAFMEPWIHIVVLIAATVIFFLASLFVLNRKNQAVI